MKKQIIIKGRALENLAKHSYQYTGDVDALLAIAKSWGYETNVDTLLPSIAFSSGLDVTTFLEDISDMEKCTTDGVVYCDWCGEFQPNDRTWHLDIMDIQPRPDLDHFCFDCGDTTKTVDFIAFVLGW